MFDLQTEGVASSPTFSVSAPGKAFLFGEYCVLEGGVAAVIAVDRFATAGLNPGTPAATESPFILAAARTARERWKIETPSLRCDTSAFLHDGVKLGLGSSAAAVVTALAVYRSAAGLPVPTSERPTAGRVELLAAALNAHALAQSELGAAGSGADVCAVTLGGIVAVTASQAKTRAVHLDESFFSAPFAPKLLFFASPEAASTPHMVRRVAQLKQSQSAQYARLITALSDTAVRLLGALEQRLEAEFIADFAHYGRLLTELGDAASVDIVPRKAAELATFFAGLGGALKPSGAGGGDLLVALLPAASDAAQIQAANTQAMELGFIPLPLSIVQRGILVSPQQSE